MSQKTSDTEELAPKHKLFEDFYELVDATLRGLGAPDGISPEPDQAVSVSLPPDPDERRGEWESCDLDDLCLADKDLLRIDITVGPLRIGRSRGRKREEVTVEATWDSRDSDETGPPVPKSRKIILTASQDEMHRDMWVHVHELKVRWSIYHGFVKHDLGGVFQSAALPANVNETQKTQLIYALTLMVSEVMEILKKIRKRNEKGLVFDF